MPLSKLIDRIEFSQRLQEENQMKGLEKMSQLRSRQKPTSPQKSKTPKSK